MVVCGRECKGGMSIFYSLELYYNGCHFCDFYTKYRCTETAFVIKSANCSWNFFYITHVLYYVECVMGATPMKDTSGIRVNILVLVAQHNEKFYHMMPLVPSVIKLL